MDKISIAIGLGVNGLVMGVNEKRKIYVKGAGDREWIFIIYAIFTDGRSIIPIIIFKGISF